MLFITGENARDYFLSSKFIYRLTSYYAEYNVRDEQVLSPFIAPDFDVSVDKQYFNQKLGQIEKEFPLLKDEILEKVECSFFQEDFEIYPRGTPVLIRTTNKCKIYFVQSGDCVINGTIEHNINLLEKTGVLFTPISNSIITSVLADLAMGVVSGVIGSLIFDKVFSAGKLPSFQEFCDEIRNIIKEEISIATIAKLQGIAQGVSTYIKNVYNPRKKIITDKKELYGLLLPQITELNKGLGILKEEQFSTMGFAVYQIYIYLLIALLQEAATVDPLADDPHKSSYCEAIRNYTGPAKDHVESIFSRMCAKRLSYFYFNVEFNWMFGFRFWYGDNLTGTRLYTPWRKTIDEATGDMGKIHFDFMRNTPRDMDNHWAVSKFGETMDSLFKNPYPKK